MIRSIVVLWWFVAAVIACSRVESKGKELVSMTKMKVKAKTSEMLDRVMPQFDAYTPDTPSNKKRFHDFLRIELTKDIHQIYCFDDAIGIDADYMFAFHCAPSTVEKIKRKHLLKRDYQTTDFAFGLQNDFKWWNKAKIAKLDLYSWNDGKSYYKYFWYDEKEQKAYFFDFDM